MKILWITQIYPWTSTLVNLLAISQEILLLCPQDTPLKSNSCKCKICQIDISDKELTEVEMTPTIASKYLDVIHQYNPDIIHVHGSERNYGQIQKYVPDIPVVISIQGILSAYIPFSANFLDDGVLQPFRSIKNYLGRGGVKHHTNMMRYRSVCYEQDILDNSFYFICRTNWDKSCITFRNPRALIYHGEELLREPFYIRSNKWNVHNCRRHSIFMPSGFNPIKGLHLALNVVILLKKYYPDVTLTVPGLPFHILSYGRIKSKIIGEEYVSYCKSIIRQNHLEENIIFRPRLDAEDMAHEMEHANVFLSPSAIDNSPNAVGEAMLVGVPIVSTPVGGVMSFLHDEDSCLFAPSGDVYLMAYQIKRIFEDDELAIKLSLNAQKIADLRHNKKNALSQYVKIYQDIINIHSHKSI